MWPNQRGGRGGFGGPRFPMMGDFGGMRPHHGGNMMHGRGGGGFNMGGGGRMPMRGGGMPMHGGGGMQNQMRGGGGGMFPRGGGDFRPRGPRGARGRGGFGGGTFPEKGPGSVVKKESQAGPKVDTASATAPAIAPGTSSTAGPATQVVPKGTGPGSKPVPVGPRQPAKPGEDEPNYDESLCILDWYCSDLNLKIIPTDFCSAEAMSKDGFGYMWAGARASYGATNGRVCFEVKISKNQPTSHLEGEANPNVLRVGWSLPSSNLQLGEIKHSYGYGGTAKISENCNFQNYGVRFGVGSVVGAYLDMSTENCTIKYTVDGKDQGIAFRFQKKELKGKGLFPHVLTKNQDFTVNFGQMPAPMRTLLAGYTPIGQLETKDGLVRGPLPPPSKSDCQVLMMVGLPGAGKTFWAEKFAVENEDKHWNILGTNNLIEKMKVQGLNRKRNYSGRWEILIKKCMECFNILLGIAARRRRNYILDQTNVYPTARGKKMKDFSGFECQAVVVVPTDDEYRRRVSEREAIEGKEVPDSAVLNMKCNFVLPEIEEASSFSEVWYTEMGPEDSQMIVAKYNQEAMSTGMFVQGGVKAFKTRNEGKRMRQNLPLPGMHVNPDKAPKLPSTPAPTPTPRPSATPTPMPSATPIPTPTPSADVKKETSKSDVKPSTLVSEVKAETTSAGPSNTNQLKDDKSQRRDPNRRSNSRSKGDKSSSRRRSRSRDRSHRDRQRSPSRERSKSDRRERRRSRDRSRDRDRTRKRSRSRSSRDRESGNQRFKQEINPWERGSSHNSADNRGGPNQGSRWNQEDGPGGRGGFSSRGRGGWEGGRDMDARGGRNEGGFKQEDEQSFRGGVGRGRGGYGDDRGRGGHFGGDRGGRGGFGDDRGGRGGFGNDRGGRGGFGNDRGGGSGFGDDRGGRGGRFGDDGGGRGGRFGDYRGGRGGHTGEDREGRFNDDRGRRGDNSRESGAFNRDEKDERRDFHRDNNPRDNFPDRGDRDGGRGGFRGGRGGFDDRSNKIPDMNRFDNEIRRPPGVERNRGGLLDPPTTGSQDHQPRNNDSINRRDKVSDAFAGQEGNNAYFNNVNNFGRPSSQFNDAHRDARDDGNTSGLSGPRNADRFSAGRAQPSRLSEQNRLTNSGPSTSQDKKTDYPRESEESQKSVKVRDLDEEFASRMERKLQDDDYTTGGDQGGYQDEYYGEGDYGDGGGQGWGDEGGYDYNSGRDYNQGYDDYRNENRHDNSYAQNQRDQKFVGRPNEEYQENNQQSGYSNPHREQYGHHNQQHRLNSSQGSRFDNQNSSNLDGRMDGPPPRHGQDPINSQVPGSNRPPPLMTRSGDYNQHSRGDYNLQGRSDFKPQGRPEYNPQSRSDSNQTRPQEMVGGPLLATTAMIPDWNKPTPQAQNNAVLREEGYPITSDGRAMNMGYSVQYHSEDSYSQQDSYHEDSVRVVHQKGPSTQGAGATGTQSMDNKSFSATSRSSFSSNDLNNPSKERLNDPSALTGMNPSAPDTSAAGSSSNGSQANPGQDTASGQANSGPDYASLLQYLQFYQKQMTTDTKK